MRFALFAALLINCSSSTEIRADLAASSVDDMAVAADLASGSDMRANDLKGVAFCDHLHAALGGAPPTDCAVEYLVRFIQCFQPSGACGRINDPNNQAIDECWATGATFEWQHLTGVRVYSYAMNGRRCGSIGTTTNGSDFTDFCFGTDPRCDSDMGAYASYLSGTLTCSDGTQVATGSLYACDAIGQFLAPACDGNADGGGCAFP